MNYLVVQLLRHEAVVARFTGKRGQLAFVEAARHPLEGSHLLPSLLEGLAPADGEERVVLALSGEQLFLRELDLPITDRRRLREVVPMQLSGETALDDDELVCDGLPLADGKVLALWGRERVVAERIGLLKEQRLEPEIVTFSACHWQHLLPSAAREGVAAVTDGEALAVFRDGALLFCRHLAGDEPAAEAARTLALVELAKGAAVRRVFLHGEAARRAGSYQAQGASDIAWLPLPATGELAATFACDEATARDLAAACAAALAASRGEAVNFRSGALAYTAGRARARRRLRLTCGLGVAALALLFAETGVRYYLVQRDLVSLNRSIGAIYREVFPTRKKAVDEVAELRSEIRRLGSGASGGSVLDVLKRVAEAKGDGVTGIYEAELDGDQVRLKGDAGSIQAVNDFKARAGKQFGSVDVGEIKTRPDGSVSFTFRGTVTGGTK
jgi:general secretion pathway protein L